MNEVCHAQTQTTELAALPGPPVCSTGYTGTLRLDTGSDQSCGQRLVSRWLARCAPSRLGQGLRPTP